jgi:hypothetical protein
MLKWEKKADNIWHGQDGWLHYHIVRAHYGFHVARAGIPTDWFEHALSFRHAKEVAQRDATAREDKIQSLPNHRE